MNHGWFTIISVIHLEVLNKKHITEYPEDTKTIYDKEQICHPEYTSRNFLDTFI